MGHSLPIDTFDPRLGEVFEVENFETKRVFSNIPQNLFVIDGIGLDWASRIELIEEAAAKTSAHFFCTFAPWWPGMRKRRDAFQHAFRDIRESPSGNLMAYFDNAQAFREIMRMRDELGGDVSGLWTLGGCIRPFRPPRRFSCWTLEDWDFAHIMGQPKRIGCALDLNEQQMSTFITRLFDGFDDWLERLDVPTLANGS